MISLGKYSNQLADILGSLGIDSFFRFFNHNGQSRISREPPIEVIIPDKKTVERLDNAVRDLRASGALPPNAMQRKFCKHCADTGRMGALRVAKLMTCDGDKWISFCILCGKFADEVSVEPAQ